MSPASRLFAQSFVQADQRKHQSSASLAFVKGIHRWPMDSPHKGPVTRKMFPFNDVIMFNARAAYKVAPCFAKSQDECYWPQNPTNNPVTAQEGVFSLWRHQMETFSALLALSAGNSPVTSEFPSRRPVTGSFDVFFDLRLKKRLSKQSRRRWFDKPSHSLWRHRNVVWHIYQTRCFSNT